MSAGAIRLLLGVAYPLLAHAAGALRNGELAALALGDIALIVLLLPLLARRAWAWTLLAIIAAGLAWLAHSPHALLPLLAPPVLFPALVAMWFGRTLRPGRIPLITRIVAALDRIPAAQLPADLYRYTRRLTLGWSLVLSTIASANLLLALLAVPDGLLERLGVASPLPVPTEHWSLFANLATYGLVGGFFVGEYYWRLRRFPGRYRSFADFLRRMHGLGPGFWQDLMH